MEHTDEPISDVRMMRFIAGALAMNGILASCAGTDIDLPTPDQAADLSMQYANAFMKKLNRKVKEPAVEKIVEPTHD